MINSVNSVTKPADAGAPNRRRINAGPASLTPVQHWSGSGLLTPCAKLQNKMAACGQLTNHNRASLHSHRTICLPLLEIDGLNRANGRGIHTRTCYHMFRSVITSATKVMVWSCWLVCLSVWSGSHGLVVKYLLVWKITLWRYSFTTLTLLPCTFY